MTILAIDPGTKESGWCLYREDGIVLESGVKPNEIMLLEIRHSYADHLAIERVASYGMSVGREVFETCEWVGEFRGMWRTKGKEAQLFYRKDVKLHLCGTVKAKDSNIRQALIDMFPATGGGKTPQIGTKAKPGPLYGVSSHAWPALAVAVTCANSMKNGSQKAREEIED